MRTVMLPTAFLKMIATTLDDLGTQKSPCRRSSDDEDLSLLGAKSSVPPETPRDDSAFSASNPGHSGCKSVGLPAMQRDPLNLSMSSLGRGGVRSVGVPAPRPDLFGDFIDNLGCSAAKSSGLTDTESHQDLSDLLMSTMTSSTGLPAFISDGTWSPSWSPQSSRRSEVTREVLWQRPSVKRPSATPPAPAPMALLRTKAMPQQRRILPQQQLTPRVHHSLACSSSESVNASSPVVLQRQQVKNSSMASLNSGACLRQVSLGTPRQVKRSHSLPAAVSVTQTVTVRTKFAVMR